MRRLRTIDMSDTDSPIDTEFGAPVEDMIRPSSVENDLPLFCCFLFYMKKFYMQTNLGLVINIY